MFGDLSGVLKPGRYIDSEWNAVRKEWDGASLKVALCFPDIYEIGMSHLGMRILYGVLNNEEGVLCERVFTPWTDMEQNLRTRGEPLVSLENKKPLRDFDIIGFSLQYEMGYADVLNMLELGGVPILSKERGDSDPIVIAGGPCAFNPEPMADFIDAFVIGEAEEAILEIARAAQGFPRRSLSRAKSRGSGQARLETQGERDKVLKELSKIEGIYIPAFTLNLSPFAIKKRIIRDLSKSYFPTSPIVPYIQIVHDRISIEIMRGCPHQCRFCQACRIFHPLRLRSVDKILEIAEESVKNTGYDEISLLSLSTGDYPFMEELSGKLEERFKDKGVRVSLPSLRVKSFDSHKGKVVMKRAGLTFAPEAGSERLRQALNKKISNEEIINQSALALRSGWKKVKLYFMIGLPGETDEDLKAIIDLASQIKNVSLSISPFIPKPHSGFENEKMSGLEELENKKEYLRSRLRTLGSRRYIKVDYHDIRMSRVEAVLSRGDRKLGSVIYLAWQKGARLQSWKDYFDYGIWDKCFEERGIQPDDYLGKADKKDSLPWNFIEA
ncbi:MAG: TIGR03960 family B12-binding radical SAM protein [Candidatus Omnitrophica bacterium]|nr:TIGR03960 family B12-binding radical SAM protein [Candidatus Omnitrophota bacterium]MBU1932917.1 TIGR03960 family B12-binding radical SAM protein [Candidatus Omnitrophota bacterium]